MEKLQQATVEAEELGELFLINRDQSIAVDRSRQATREALTALRKHARQHQHEQTGKEQKVWLQSSHVTFRKTPLSSAIAQLESEMLRLDERVNQLRVEQKSLILRLADKGATPEELGDGLLGALLHLKDRRQQSKGQ